MSQEKTSLEQKIDRTLDFCSCYATEELIEFSRNQIIDLLRKVYEVGRERGHYEAECNYDRRLTTYNTDIPTFEEWIKK